VSALAAAALLLLFIFTSVIRHSTAGSLSRGRLELSDVERRLSAFSVHGHGTSRHGCPGPPAPVRDLEVQGEKLPAPLVLVTGGAGFIGASLVRLLLELGYRVRVLDNLSTGQSSNLPQHGVQLMVGDITNASACGEAMVDASAVIHLAAASRVAPSLESPQAAAECVRANVDGTLNVLEAARAQGIARFVYAGSSTAYGGDDDSGSDASLSARAFQDAYGIRPSGPLLPSWELDRPSPRSPYAASKHAGELLVQSYGTTFGVSTVILRLYMVYGPREQGSGPQATVVAALIADATAGRALRIQGDGTQTRDFVHVEDVARAFVLALQAPELPRGAVINIGTGEATSVAALAELIHPGELRAMEPRRRMDIQGTLANNCAAQALLGWRPTISLKEGIRRLMQQDAPV
jgi:UDP-glucose 4-epimerase